MRIGSSLQAPLAGTAPLHRAGLSASLLQSVESALADIYRDAPLGSQIVPFPETQEVDLADLARGFSGAARAHPHARIGPAAAGGPAPAQDCRPAEVTPDLRGAACGGAGRRSGRGHGGLRGAARTGPWIRRRGCWCGRLSAIWRNGTLRPLAMLLAEEATAKPGTPVMTDVMRPLQALDSGLRARGFYALVEAMARAKEAGLSDEQVNTALTFVNLGPDDGAA